MNRSFIIIGLLFMGLMPVLTFARGSDDQKVNQDVHQLKKDYQNKVDKDLKDLDRKIGLLKHRVLKTDKKIRAGVERDVKRLEAQKADADRKFAALQRSSGDAWKDLSKDMDKAVADLKRSVDEANDRLKAKK